MSVLSLWDFISKFSAIDGSVRTLPSEGTATTAVCNRSVMHSCAPAGEAA